MTKQKEITLDNLTSALKAVHGQETAVPLLIFRHWAKRHYDMSKATPEFLQEIEESFLEMYNAAQPLERLEALDLLSVYDEHLCETAPPEEQRAIAIAAGRTPLEYELMTEGFSLRELMQALKALEAHNGPAPEDMLTVFFERYLCERLKDKRLITKMPELIAQYRREPAMKSDERARAILEAFGVRLLDSTNPADVEKWKTVSGATEH